jgi:GDP/UDP-N,N'-diacetylbacillosamine 2-epimerase (hydrolysing)
MKKVCVVTGTRAEYDLLRPIISGLLAESDIETLVFVTGMHLSPEFGMTVDRIESDEIPIMERIEILLSSDQPVGIGKSMGLALIGFSEAFARHKPDMVVLLGDRFEAFCAAAAATVMRVPVAHLHGGESSFGAIDEAFRHSITKMSRFHFASTEEYRRRIIRLGESPERIYNVGAIGVELAKNIDYWSREKLEADLRIKLGKRNAIVTFHPATSEMVDAGEQFGMLLEALEGFPDLFVVFTKSNADASGRAINEMIDDFAKRRVEQCASFASLGQVRYFSLMRLCDVVIGNSSSGIIEAPSLGIPTVNIGSRQSGRIRAPSVIDSPAETAGIRVAIARALEPEFRARCATVTNPYEGMRTTSRVIDLLKSALSEPMKPKTFYDGCAESV